MDWLVDDGANTYRVIEKRPYTLNYYLPYLEYWDDGGEFQRQQHARNLDLVIAEMKELWASKARTIARCKAVKKEMMAWFWHPDRYDKWIVLEGDDD